ncbi:MAG: Crp/Fnr family transcriptional regulator [Spirosomataceae bacterium]
MIDSLKKHIAKYITLKEEELVAIGSFFGTLECKKKENLLTEGKISKSNYFVAAGCLRLFFINDKGVEQTIQFAIENWWLADYASFESQKPSEFYIQAVEKSTILSLDFEAQEAMLRRFPQMERYFRLMHQRAHAASQFRIKGLYDLSREELYYQFSRQHPDFVQRIPQYLLASFLGFTPEYLSEIRSKRIS